MERKVYPIDITGEQFEVIRPMLEGAKHKTAPRKVDLYDVFCAILYPLEQALLIRLRFIAPSPLQGEGQ